MYKQLLEHTALKQCVSGDRIHLRHEQGINGQEHWGPERMQQDAVGRKLNSKHNSRSSA